LGANKVWIEVNNKAVEKNQREIQTMNEYSKIEFYFGSLD